MDRPPKKKTRAERYAARDKKNVESDAERTVAAATETKEKNSATAVTTQPSGPTIEDTSKFTQQETADVRMKPVDVEPSSSNEVSTCHSTSSANTGSDDKQSTGRSPVESNEQQPLASAIPSQPTDEDSREDDNLVRTNVMLDQDQTVVTTELSWTIASGTFLLLCVALIHILYSFCCVLIWLYLMYLQH